MNIRLFEGFLSSNSKTKPCFTLGLSYVSLHFENNIIKYYEAFSGSGQGDSLSFLVAVQLPWSTESLTLSFSINLESNSFSSSGYSPVPAWYCYHPIISLKVSKGHRRHNISIWGNYLRWVSKEQTFESSINYIYRMKISLVMRVYLV